MRNESKDRQVTTILNPNLKNFLEEEVMVVCVSVSNSSV